MRGSTDNLTLKGLEQIARLTTKENVKKIKGHEYYPISSLIPHKEVSRLLNISEEALENEQWKESIKWSWQVFQISRNLMMLPTSYEIFPLLEDVDEELSKCADYLYEILITQKRKIEGMEDVPFKDIEKCMDFLMGIIDLAYNVDYKKRFAFEYFSLLEPDQKKLIEVAKLAGQTQLDDYEIKERPKIQYDVDNAVFCYNYITTYILLWSSIGAFGEDIEKNKKTELADDRKSYPWQEG